MSCQVICFAKASRVCAERAQGDVYASEFAILL